MENLNKISFGQLETAVESRQGFKPNANLYGGLCIGTITKCEIEEHEVPKQLPDGTPSSWDFAGLKTYQLVIEFKQVLEAKDNTERFITLRETIVSSKKNTGEEIAPKVWHSLQKSQYDRLQHIVNALDKAKLGTMSTNIKDIDIEFNDAPEVRITKLKKFFEHFVKQINGKDAKPRWEGAKFWMRVVTDTVRGTYYVIPSFVGKGFIEVLNANLAPTIELAVNDSIELKKKQDKNMNANSKDADAVKEAPVQGQSANDVLKNLGINIPS